METLTHDYRCPNCGAPMSSEDVFDRVDTYYGCTVQILTNTVTGQVSIGWWQEEYDDTEGCDVPL